MNAEKGNDTLATNNLEIDFGALVNSYRITTATLKDIWAQANHLVSTPGFISLVPGQCDSSNNRMVASVTGGEPHYVSEKKSRFFCDGKCPRFNTYKICQHVIAAAQSCGMLRGFCDWWKSLKSSTNIDSLAMIGIPKGAGQKGGVPKRRRKNIQLAREPKKILRTERIDSDLPCSSKSDQRLLTLTGASHVAVDGAYTSATQTHREIPSSIYNYGSINQSFNPHFSGNQLPHQGISNDGSHVVNRNRSSPFIPQSLPQPTANNTSFPYFSPHGKQPFYLKMLTKQIRVCGGCRCGFNNETRIPDPPYNVCVAHEEPYTVSPQSGKAFTRKTVVHYHMSPECIWLKEPFFNPSQIVISQEILDQLTASHKAYLAQYFAKIV